MDAPVIKKRIKATDLVKKSISTEQIYRNIQTMVNSNPEQYKHFIPNNIYVSDEVRLQLLNDGFKVYRGDWDGIMKDCLIIEW